MLTGSGHATAVQELVFTFNECSVSTSGGDGSQDTQTYLGKQTTVYWVDDDKVLDD